MTIELKTNAEKYAAEAESLPAFSGVSLLHIKRNVAELLGQIGGNGIFDAYTRHDISHINEMLEMLDWLIPDHVLKVMTPADWLLVVLSIYFHDMGMLVTRDEYEARAKSDFDEFCKRVLFGTSLSPKRTRPSTA